MHLIRQCSIDEKIEKSSMKELKKNEMKRIITNWEEALSEMKRSHHTSVGSLIDYWRTGDRNEKERRKKNTERMKREMGEKKLSSLNQWNSRNVNYNSYLAL